MLYVSSDMLFPYSNSWLFHQGTSLYRGLTIESTERKLAHLKEPCICFEADKLPLVITLKGPSAEQQWYLFEAIYPFA
jgi:hypothetical protein